MQAYLSTLTPNVLNFETCERLGKKVSIVNIFSKSECVFEGQYDGHIVLPNEHIKEVTDNGHCYSVKYSNTKRMNNEMIDPYKGVNCTARQKYRENVFGLTEMVKGMKDMRK